MQNPHMQTNRPMPFNPRMPTQYMPPGPWPFDPTHGFVPPIMQQQPMHRPHHPRHNGTVLITGCRVPLPGNPEIAFYIFKFSPPAAWPNLPAADAARFATRKYVCTAEPRSHARNAETSRRTLHAGNASDQRRTDSNRAGQSKNNRLSSTHLSNGEYWRRDRHERRRSK